MPDGRRAAWPRGLTTHDSLHATHARRTGLAPGHPTAPALAVPRSVPNVLAAVSLNSRAGAQPGSRSARTPDCPRSRSRGAGRGGGRTRSPRTGPGSARCFWHQLRSPLLALLLAAAHRVVLRRRAQRRRHHRRHRRRCRSGSGSSTSTAPRRPRRRCTTRSTTETVVIRDGAPGRVDVTDLVPGDVVELRLGDIVPADLRLLEVDRPGVRRVGADRRVAAGRQGHRRRSPPGPRWPS